MPSGKLKKLVHLSQQSLLQNSRLVPDHNDKGYGIIEDAEGRDVYFSYEMVQSCGGFDLLRMGQELEYMLEKQPYLRAVSVTIANPTAAVMPIPKA